ncbi:polysaccharide pyruvyl transferase family protein [Paraferrimonas sedimenticola]|uniref:Polysaccharide pyruvyl transferase domain-containing protein n=1 Tax=Paraferrimonas sedimenticola TaxID=375674 RepID=A0AA37RWT2_9GAMM|nr:polysaccharide pyruvyl transferase family protein [Paraferrimonas sedimenticola]GLP96768.1 hypothetical protein GCM10007895_20740 [Paraferrimonas sedimenticola]
MEKIGILTYHASHNMGSMLQTYAMQYILSNHFKMEVEVVNYSSKGQQNMYSMFPSYKGWKGLARLIINAVSFPVLKSRYNDYELFINDAFNLSGEKFDTLVELEKVCAKYDFLVVGSDQIWNVNCEDFTDAYFLPFSTSASKIAYAPSLGGRNLLNSGLNLEKYKNYIKDFTGLSVREVNGKAWLEKLSNEHFEIVADPTILVETSVWDSLAKPRLYEEDYIFFYGVPFSPDTYDIVMEISKELGMSVVMLDAKQYVYRGNFLKGIKLSRNSSPSDYLSLIKHSSLVITTSFHGSIFSTVFRKNFWAITFKGTNKDDDRIRVLFDQLNMSERLIYIEEHKQHDLLEPVNYDGFDELMNDFRRPAMKYLANSLPGIKNKDI